MTDALVENTADAGQVRNARQKEKTRAKQEAADLRELVERPAFMRFVRRYLAHTGFMRSEYSADTNQMAFNAGQRNIGLRLFADVGQAAPSAIAALMQPEET